jgi:hypothetical protein
MYEESLDSWGRANGGGELWAMSNGRFSFVNVDM